MDRPLDFGDLQRLCMERAEESLALEFKPCNELKVGSPVWDRDGTTHPRTQEEMLDELTKDVAGFLNAAGGVLIYGIQESHSRAEAIDSANAFRPGNRQDEIRPEKVIQWLRAHIQPAPSPNVYCVFEQSHTPTSVWYLVIDVPQGLQAYMARDHRFYKRVGNTTRQMEQYEVVDVMNRSRAAALEMELQLGRAEHSGAGWETIDLGIAITSTNFVASEYGAVKLTVAYPLKIASIMLTIFRSAPQSTGLFLDGEADSPHAASIMMPWGANTGSIVFPGDWFNFHGHRAHIDVPDSSVLPSPTFLVQIELFTMNAYPKKMLFSLFRPLPGENFGLRAVETSAYAATVASFWETYHAARARLPH